ncbi:hypothetical protein BDY17DRAFT_317759 [Neohortaea acidophila]|uniref:Cupin type-1 domain-containing protein n=1 Tax=Neohortaea acidophila TaxID=245834 RepID=A0A6A6PQ18_9PEZI|nr:uncharacterized protein BDY17DRAFT_317759 [Neohortaea acidophila]KAF2482198.1 hypothetical protein BDY17DRAFT_317759 [Neohortaea acidophila]
MVEVRKYHLSPTALIPNSPQPLLHYPGLLSKETSSGAATVHDIYSKNGWETRWIFRYGPTQVSHYHSKAHECMTVLTGSATIRFGVADTSDDLDASTHGDAREAGGVELQANAGDVFIIPAGVAHKTHDTTAGSTFALLTPGEGQSIPTPDPRQTLAEIELSGFTMMGAYPKNGANWDFAVGGENEGDFAAVWNVAKPELDPILGDAKDGLVGLWQ